MIVRCPQCQYANKVEVETAKPRIVCARCATVISIEFLSSSTIPPGSDVTSERKGPELISTMQTPETSPLDLDTLLETPETPVVHTVLAEPLAGIDVEPLAAPVAVAVEAPVVTSVEAQPLIAVEPQNAPVVMAETSPLLDVDEDEILDIPRNGVVNATATPALYETASGVEDVLSPMSTNPEVLAVSEAEIVQETVIQASSYEQVEAVYQNESEPAMAAGSGEPITGEVVGAAAGAVGQSHLFLHRIHTISETNNNTFVMATPDKSNTNRLAKLFGAAALICALLAFGWYVLAGLVKDWFGLNKPQVAVTAPPPAVNPEPVKPAAQPGTAPSLGAKVGESNNKAAGTAATAASATPSVAAKSSPTATPAAAKTAPTPAPVQPANTGHSVGSSDGSITIQVAAYKSAGEAQSTAARLKNAGLEARIVKADVPGKGTWYRVQTGRYTNEAEAAKHGTELKAKGALRDFIVTGYQAQ